MADEKLNTGPGEKKIPEASEPVAHAAMESINGWIKSELFTDFHLPGENI